MESNLEKVKAEIERLIKRAEAERVLHPKTILAAKNYLLIEDYKKLISFIDSIPEEPTVCGWVARDEDGALHFFSSECGDGVPCFDKDSGTWGNATFESLELPRQGSIFGDLSFIDEPVEVELIIRKV